MAILGNTLPKIAEEKAGIFKRGVPAVIGEPDPQVAGFLGTMAIAAGADHLVIGRPVTQAADPRAAAQAIVAEIAAAAPK